MMKGVPGHLSKSCLVHKEPCFMCVVCTQVAERQRRCHSNIRTQNFVHGNVIPVQSHFTRIKEVHNANVCRRT